MEKPMLRGAIYDMDGVIVKTEHIQYLGWVVPLIRDFDVDLSKEFYIKHYAGKNGDIIEDMIKQDFHLDFEKNYLLHEKEKLLPGWFENWDLTEMPYAKESIDFFKNSGLKMAIASSGIPEEIKIKLRRMGLDGKFEEVVSKNEVKRGKPFGDIYEFAAKKIGLDAKECLAIEDTNPGIESAYNAKIGCVIAVPHEYSASQDFSKANIVVRNLREAINKVKENYQI